MRRKTLGWTVAAVIILLITGAAFYASGQLFGGCVREGRSIYIGTDTDYKGLTDSVMPSIGHHVAFRLYASHIGLDKSFKPGHYTLKEGMNVIDVARMFKLGRQTPVMVRINNVRTAAELAHKLSVQLAADSASIMAALRDRKLATKLGFGGGDLLPMFIPNSYEFYWTASPEEIVTRMRKEYYSFWTGEREKARKNTGLSRAEVITLASIVGEETNKTDEMPRIAGVYMNRLRRDMPLQADPTVKYAVGDFTLRRILYKHLEWKSPYNTYINRGLPPSPISMPSIAAIDAVLHYEKHDYLYFCARPTLDGYHSFARTLAEHNANSRAYSAELNRRNIK